MKKMYSCTGYGKGFFVLVFSLMFFLPRIGNSQCIPPPFVTDPANDPCYQTVISSLPSCCSNWDATCDQAYQSCQCPFTDCAGVCNGTASVDNCGICSGGTTGIVPNSEVDACGICPGQPGYGLGPDFCGLCPNDPGYGQGHDACGLCPQDPGYGQGPDICGFCPGDPNYGLGMDACGFCPGDANYGVGPDVCGICPGQPGYGLGPDVCGFCPGNPSYGLGPDVCGICPGQPGYGLGPDVCGFCPGNPNYGVGPDVCGFCPGDPNYGLGRDVCGICPGQPGYGLGRDRCGYCPGDPLYNYCLGAPYCPPNQCLALVKAVMPGCCVNWTTTCQNMYNKCTTSTCNTTDGNWKYKICHREPRKKPVLICVDLSGAVTHLTTHLSDNLGTCGSGKTDEEDDNTDVTLTETQLTAYPNPFSDAVNIVFSVPDKGKVVLELFDSKGASVSRLFDAVAESASEYKVEVDGNSLATGIYIARMVTEKEVLNYRLVLTR